MVKERKWYVPWYTIHIHVPCGGSLRIALVIPRVASSKGSTGLTCRPNDSWSHQQHSNLTQAGAADNWQEYYMTMRVSTKWLLKSSATFQFNSSRSSTNNWQQLCETLPSVNNNWLPLYDWVWDLTMEWRTPGQMTAAAAAVISGIPI